MPSEPVEVRKPSSQSMAAPDDRHLKAVLGDLFEHTQVLVRQEIELGKAEVEARVAHAKAALVRGAIAAGLYYAAYLTSLTGLVLLLAQWMPAWLGALIVALLASAGAAIFTRLGQASVQAVRHPSETSSVTPQRKDFHDTAKERDDNHPPFDPHGLERDCKPEGRAAQVDRTPA